MMKCIHDLGFDCIKVNGVKCDEPGLLLCLKANVEGLSRKLDLLNTKQMARHNKASVKWRSRAQYYELKAKQQELYMIYKGLDVPSSAELSQIRANTGGFHE